MKKRIISAILFTLVAIFAFIPAISLTAEAAEETRTYTFSDYTAGTQYADNEEHVLDENITVVTTDCHFTTQLRIYSSSTNNGYAIIKAADNTTISAISVNAGYKTDTLVVYGSNDGDTWTEAGSITTTTTSYKDYSLDLNAEYKWLKLDVSGTNQIRIASMTLTLNISESAACEHTNTTTETTKEATCTEAGSITVTCDDCKQVIGTEEIPATGHSYVNGSCSECGEEEPKEVVFDFGEMGSATHKDGSSSASTYSETSDNYTLNITGGTNMYPESYDAKGNSCIKLGTGSKIGSFSFIVPDDVVSVIIHVAQYKADTTKIQVNGTDYTITTASNNGAYTEITVDTTSTKTVSFTTVSGGIRCMIDKIVYHLDANACAHENYTSETTDSTCTENGYTTYTCTECGHTYTDNETPALGHTWDDGVITVEPGITTEGEKTYTCDVCKATKTEVLSAKGYTATFAVPGGITAPDKKSGLYIYLPELESTTYTDENEITYTFVGWSTEEFGDTTTPNFYNPNSKVDLTEDTVFYAVYSLTTGGNGGSGDYVLTELSEILATDKVVIVFTHSNGTTYAVTNNNGTSKAPGGTVVTIDGNKLSATPDDTLIWNISNSSGNLTIYPDGDTSTWLYCTSTNNGVRVGTNANNVFTLDSTTGYLKHTATSRYLGIYSTTPDLRCYTTHTTSNIANQTVTFYVQSSGGTTTYKTIGCLHENAEQEIIGNCGESGTKKITCNDCGYVTEKEIAKIDHEYTVTEVIAPTCTSGGYTLNTCSRCGSTYRSDLTDASEHSFDANGSCTVCGALNAAVYDLSGKYYISTARTDGNYWYMSSIINLASNGNTHRYSAVSSGLTTLPESITSPNLSRIFVLERINDGEDEGKYLIYAFGIVGEEKYVGYTVTDPENPENSATFVSRENALKLTIENVTAEKTFTFSFGEGDEKRSLALYSNPGSDFFAFYKSNSSQKKNLSLIPIGFDGTDADEFTGASLNIGSDLSIRYHAVPNMESSLDSYSVRFTMNGKEVTVQGVAEDGKLVFSFKGIAPQFMGSSIKAELLLDGEIIDTVESYSVKQYVIDAIALHSTDTYLCTLLSDVLYYGAAAQRYLNKNVAEEALVTYGVADLTPSEITTTDADKQRSIVTATGADTTLVKYTAAGVRFDYNNRIYVKFTTTDVANVTVTVSGSALEIIPLGNNTYAAYSEGISALEFDNAVSFKLYYSENLIQTLNYTVNTYAWDKNADSEIGDLALALYRYGKSTAAYEESKSINY